MSKKQATSEASHESALPTSSESPSSAHAEARPPGRILPRRVGHDLRTCLGQVLGYSELWMEDCEDQEPAQFQADMHRIHTAGEQILALINQYIDPVTSRVDQFTRGTLASAEHTQRQTTTATDSPQAAESAVHPPTEQGAILVVDDDETNRALLLRQFARHGHRPTVVGDGQQALQMLAQQPFDLILLDILMPGMDGYTMLQHLKADPALRHIPVLMISALDELASVARCIELGAEDYLLKPFDPVLLWARINACLEKKRLRDQEIRLHEQLEANYKRLQTLETLRDDFTHMIVHDLRTPLTSLLTGVQTLQLIATLPCEQAELLDIAVAGGQNLLRRINDLLDIGKMEAGALRLRYTEIMPEALIARSLGQVMALAQDSELTIQHDLPADLPTLCADEELLTRTLVNLLGNAIKFTPSHGTITVGVRRVPGEEMLRFSVRDTGEGIPPEARERIFDKFGQVENHKAGREMSTGLGLTFCKMVVEAHGGRIWVESEIGQGSIFTFLLPRHCG